MARRGIVAVRADCAPMNQRTIEAAQSIGARPRLDARCVGRDRTGPEPEAAGRTTQPWSTCRRPWSLMYFTAHGRALPCCIAPFSARGYDSYTLGDATQQTLREIWNGPAYQDFRGALLSETPPRAVRRIAACAGACDGRPALPHGVAAVIPTLNEAETIAGGRSPRSRATWCDEIIVADSASRDGTRGDRARRRCARRLADRARLWPCLCGRRGGGRCGVLHHPVPRRRRRRSRRSGRQAGRADPAGTHDFVIGSRVRGEREPGSMSWHQVLAGRLAGWFMSRAVRRPLHRHVRLPGHPPRRAGAARHARDDLRLEHRDADEGRARRAAHPGTAGALRRRAGGSSKVAGSLRGSIRAGWRIILTVARVAMAGRAARRLAVKRR